MKVLLIGAGMYVTGRNVDGSRGTIGPALMEAVRAGLVVSGSVATTRVESSREGCDALAGLAQEMGVECPFAPFPVVGNDPRAYIQAAQECHPDAAIISVPDHLHAEIAVEMASLGIHCLVVKPMADSLAGAKRMLEASRHHQVIGQVEFHKRYDESNLVLRDVIQSGKLGDPLYALIQYSQKKLIPRDVFRAWSSNTNIFQYLGVHYVDLLQWATGFVPVKVSSWGQKRYLPLVGIDTCDAMQVVVEWQRKDGSSFVSTHLTNWIDPDQSSAMSDQSICIVGTKGRFVADQKHRGIELVTDDVGTRHLNPYFTQAYSDPVSGFTCYDGYGIKSILRFLRDVHDVRSGRVSADDLESVRPSFAQCVTSTAVVEAANRSLELGGIPVEVER